MTSKSEARPGSRRVPPYAWVLWVLASIGIASLATPLHEWAFPYLLVLFFVMFFANQSGAQIGALRNHWLALGPVVAVAMATGVAVLLSSWGNAWLAWLPFATGLNVVWRYVAFERVGYTRFWWFDLIQIGSSFPIYVIGNLADPDSSVGWYAFAPAMVFSVVGLVMVVQRQRRMMSAARGAVRVGDPAPDFTLESHRAETVTLSDFRGERSVLLFFVRGDWCPGCHIMLRSYEKNREKFKAKNTAVLAIGPDPMGVNKEMVETLRLEYGLLTDESLETAKRYGVLLEGKQPGLPYEAGMATPTSFLIDQEGVVRFSSQADEVGMILRPEDIFPALEAIE